MKNLQSTYKYIAFFLSIWLFLPSQANASVTLSSIDTLTKSCGSNQLYLGPNLAAFHGGSCVSSSYDITSILYATYTLDAGSCGVGKYVGPWKAYEHGGYCLSSTTMIIDAVPTLDRNKCSPDVSLPSGGNSVYVGPKKEWEHGGYCLRLVPNEDGPLLPVVSLNLSNSLSTTTTPVTYTWESRFADVCTLQLFDNSFASDSTLNGSMTTIIATAGDHVSTFECTGPGGTNRASVTLRVIESSGGGGTNPAPIISMWSELCASSLCGNNAVYINVNAVYADSCIYNTIGFFNTPIPTTARILTSVFTSTQTATATCTGPGGTSNQTIAVGGIPINNEPTPTTEPREPREQIR